jgi:hypothetical protein
MAPATTPARAVHGDMIVLSQHLELALDHDNFESARSKIMNVIDSRG